MKRRIAAQRASAIKKPGLSALHDYKACLTAARQSQTNGELTAWCQRVHDKYQNYWQTHDVTVAENWLTQDPPPDRLQLADLVTSVIEASSAETVNVLELGSFAGINLQLPHALRRSKRRSRFVQNNAAAVDIGNTVLDGPTVTGLSSTVKLRVCRISGLHDQSVLILTPEMVYDQSERPCNALIICDDIYNVNGDIPVVPARLYHAHLPPLVVRSRVISAVIMADVPDRSAPVLSSPRRANPLRELILTRFLIFLKPREIDKK